VVLRSPVRPTHLIGPVTIAIVLRLKTILAKHALDENAGDKLREYL